MLTGRDDSLGHQIPSTFDHVHTSDPMWTERLWFSIENVRTGQAIFDAGLGLYPNKNVQDAFAGITLEGTQYNVRMSRRLRPNAGETSVGPLSFQLVEPLKRHRLSLTDNESGLAFDIEWEARFNAHEEEHHYRRRRGKVVEDLSRYSQAGRARGTLRLPTGQTLTLDPNDWFAQRDHSWGVRLALRTEPEDPNKTVLPAYFYNWVKAQFPSCSVHCFFNERAPGNYMYISGEIIPPLGQDPSKDHRVIDVEHHMVFAPGAVNQVMESETLELRLANGDSKKLELRALPARYYLRSGMYGGWRGWHHGDDKGAYYFEHDVWDLADGELLRRIGTFSDHVVECRMDGELGYGIIEYGVSRGYPRYQEVQHLPPF